MTLHCNLCLTRILIKRQLNKSLPIVRVAQSFMKERSSGDRSFCKTTATNNDKSPETKRLDKTLPLNLTLRDFIEKKSVSDKSLLADNELEESIPYVHNKNLLNKSRKVYLETYGCQMNTNDSEIALSILNKNGFLKTDDINQADVMLMMTCSIREGAEQKVRKRLRYFNSLKQKQRKQDVRIGVLGCMAERLKTKLLDEEKCVDVVCGPDAYKDLPRLLDISSSGQSAVNVLLSLDETYADVVPVRLDPKSPAAFVSIIRGCDNMCSYCIVPFTRGRERSRPMESILDEVRILSDQGIKQVTLLGQNVNSYLDKSETKHYGGVEATKLSQGFTTIYMPKVGGRRFSELLDRVSLVDPEMRIRFTSPHPKDFPDEVLHIMKERPNISNCIHLPAQSGNNDVLSAMRRGYTREAYLDLVHHIKNIIPDVGLTSDFISGFCGETEEAHKETVKLMEYVQYDYAFCFPYSMRQKTHAYHRLKDDVPEEVKRRRHEELKSVFRTGVLKRNQSQIGQRQLIMAEKVSKRSEKDMIGRNEMNKGVIFAVNDIPSSETDNSKKKIKSGDYVVVQITGCSSEVLHGTALYHTTLQDFYCNET